MSFEPHCVGRSFLQGLCIPPPVSLEEKIPLSLSNSHSAPTSAHHHIPLSPQARVDEYDPVNCMMDQTQKALSSSFADRYHPPSHASLVWQSSSQPPVSSTTAFQVWQQQTHQRKQSRLPQTLTLYTGKEYLVRELWEQHPKELLACLYRTWQKISFPPNAVAGIIKHRHTSCDEEIWEQYIRTWTKQGAQKMDPRNIRHISDVFASRSGSGSLLYDEYLVFMVSLKTWMHSALGSDRSCLSVGTSAAPFLRAFISSPQPIHMISVPFSVLTNSHSCSYGTLFTDYTATTQNPTVPPIQFVEWDRRQWNQSEKRFSCIWLGQILHHLDEEAGSKLLERVRDLLLPKGWLIVWDQTFDDTETWKRSLVQVDHTLCSIRCMNRHQSVPQIATRLISSSQVGEWWKQHSFRVHACQALDETRRVPLDESERDSGALYKTGRTLWLLQRE